MQANKKRILTLAILLLLVGLGIYFAARPAANTATYDNLIINGSFRQVDGEGMPENWYTGAYFHHVGTAFEVTEEGAHIQNPQLNDARFYQTVAVAPDTLYCLRGMIRSDATGGKGANLSIENVYAFSDSVYDSNGEWQEVFLYGRTGKNQHYVTVYARLGGYSGEAEGEAWFRDITLNRVDEIPMGYWAQDFAPVSYEPEKDTSADTQSTSALTIVFACVLYSFLFLTLKKKLAAEALSRPGKKQLIPILTILLVAFLGRLFAALMVPGYDVDIGCFTSWASTMAQVGPTEFYNTVSFCDYPPGYMNILWLIGLIGNALGGVTEWMVKLPAIFSDVLICLILYLEGKKHAGHRTGLMLCLFFALNPASFVSGACWGQTDSLMALLLLLSVMGVLQNRWKWALPAFVAAVLMKPQALMFGPMGVAALLLYLKNKKNKSEAGRDLLLGMGLSLMVFAVLALPFIVNLQGEKKGLFFLLSLYGDTMGSYGYVTINACNPYFLLGLNWYPTENMATLPGVLLPAFIAVVPALFACIYHSKKQWKRNVSLLYTALLSVLLAMALSILSLSHQLTFAALSTCMIVYAVALCCGQFLLRGDMKQLPLFAAALLMLLFACAGMMHERYLFPVIVLLLLGYALTKDKRLLYLTLLITLSSFINIACVLDRNIRIGGVEAHLSAPLCNIESDMPVWEYLSALLNTISAMACVYITLSPAQERAVNPIEEPAEEGYPMPAYEQPHIPAFTLRDALLMLGGTVLYAMLAFTNLGSMKAPETAWVTETPGESVVLDLGEEREFAVLYYAGIHWSDSTFNVEVSRDQVSWDFRQGNATYGDCFKWQYVTGTQYTPLTGRYVRITANQNDLTLKEIILRDAQTKEPIPYTIIENYASDSVQYIMDEQDTLEGEPGWYNSTYFDEIYHARTGYEHLHGLPTYETSHPPLGKVLISWAIATFGMTPFGWRFAGALAGMLMLPGLYLLGKLLIKNKWGGLFAMLMMAFDLMHFTQTRIATIDSFVVLFIIWAVYFMLYWFKMDYFHKPFWKTLVPLSLSGLFMGLSIASKWTGCYNGVGLAVLFFWGLWRRFRVWNDARMVPEKKRTAEEYMTVKKGATLLITVASCFIFFIFVPLVIYYLSYIPYFAWDGGVTVKKVIEAAVGSYFTTGQVGGMLGYHAQPGLGMDHDFYSPWYEWPLIIKPMWYYASGHNTPERASTIMAMGNPAVWWVCLLGLAGVALMAMLRHVKCDLHLTKDRKLQGGITLSLFTKKDDPRYLMLIICFMAQFLPWMLVPRGTYIYHYFPSVPFIILCTGLCLDKLSEKKQKAALIIGLLLLIAALSLFIAFFPYASGMPALRTWLEGMKWFPGWLWY